LLRGNTNAGIDHIDAQFIALRPDPPSRTHQNPTIKRIAQRIGDEIL
jgi:hypothetical protein